MFRRLSGALFGTRQERFEAREASRLAQLDIEYAEQARRGELPIQAELARRAEERKAELAAFPPVERMTARIDIRGQTLFLYLQVSEEERAIINQSKLGEVVLEDYPMFSEDEITLFVYERARQLEQHDRGLRNPQVIQWSNEAAEAMLKTEIAAKRKQRRQVHLYAYLHMPYERYFPTMVEAQAYGEKLKKEILPKIKQLIERARGSQGTTQIIEF